jgi:hypothetical protein
MGFDISIAHAFILASSGISDIKHCEWLETVLIFCAETSYTKLSFDCTIPNTT